MSHKMETRLIWFKEIKPLCKRLLYYMLFFVNFSEKNNAYTHADEPRFLTGT